MARGAQLESEVRYRLTEAARTIRKRVWVWWLRATRENREIQLSWTIWRPEIGDALMIDEQRIVLVARPVRHADHWHVLVVAS